MRTNIPDNDAIKAAIEQSGYVLELKLCPIFEKAGYAVLSGKQFQDQDTGKSREIDIYVWKDKVLFSRDHPNEAGTILNDVLRTTFLVECKNNQLPVIFFTRESLYPGIGDLLICGQPAELQGVDGIPEDGVLSIDQYLELSKFHRNYQFDSLAYRFSQMRRRKRSDPETDDNDWVLVHDDLYDSIHKIVKASQVVVDEINEVAEEKYGVNEVFLGLVYPLLIFSGPIYECEVAQRGYQLKQTKHLALTWSIESETCKSRCQIDVIAADYLSLYLKKLQESDRVLEKAVSKDLVFFKENVLMARERKRL